MPASGIVVAMLIACFLMVLAFEATNGFHDTSNAVATVIYTNTLKPVPAVIWSGIMNFVGVHGGRHRGRLCAGRDPAAGRPDAARRRPRRCPCWCLSSPPPCCGTCSPGACGIPNSSSHCIIGALVGVACADSLLQSRALSQGVDWHQIWKVLEALALSPILGLVLAGGLYGLLRLTVRRGHLFEPPEGDTPPVWWLRGLLVLTCTSVSFSHGTNDGQKSIGLIMLTIIGLLPATYALNPKAGHALDQVGVNARAAIPLIQAYGDDRRQAGITAATRLLSFDPGDARPTTRETPEQVRIRTTRRGDIYSVLAQPQAQPGEADAQQRPRRGFGRGRHAVDRVELGASAVDEERLVRAVGGGRAGEVGGRRQRTGVEHHHVAHCHSRD